MVKLKNKGCFTCLYYDEGDSFCNTYGRTPFISELGNCGDWKDNESAIVLWNSLGNYIKNTNSIISLDDSRQLMRKESTCYRFDNGIIKQKIYEILKEINIENTAYVDKVLDYLKYHKDIEFNRNNFIYDMWIVPFEDGIWGVKENKFLSPIKKNYPKGKLFCELPFEFKKILMKKPDCPEFKKNLKIWIGKPIRPSDVFEQFGYFMSISNGLKTAFLYYGETDTAKSQLANILIEILGGKPNVSNISLIDMNRRFGSRFLEFVSANIGIELPYKKIGNTTVFKASTGGDSMIKAEIKGGDIYFYKNSARHCFTADRIPPLSVIDEAFLNRFILIPFIKRFKRGSSERIEKFSDTITKDINEMEGIIYQSIKALRILYKRGYFRLKIYENTKHIWNYESDALYGFLYDFCERESKNYILQKEFCEKFNDFLLFKGFDTKKQNSITVDLQRFNIGTWQKFKQSERYYNGIKWKISDKETNLTLFEKQFGIKPKDDDVENYNIEIGEPEENERILDDWIDFDIEKDKIAGSEK